MQKGGLAVIDLFISNRIASVEWSSREGYIWRIERC